MSNPSWTTALLQALKTLPRGDGRPRIAVVGVGHELNGDDAAGIAVSRALMPRWAASQCLLAVDGGPAPENETGRLRAFHPDLVVLVDAAQMNEEPGCVRWLSWESITGISASTHTLPLSLLAQFMRADFGCEVALLGIQPAGNQLISPLSPVVQQAVAGVVADLSAALADLCP